MNKFLHDDKGSTLIACWGLPPYSFADDATRCVRAALRAFASLTELGLTPSIGVTKGDAYCGVTGSIQRREYTVLGDSINLAARLMAQKNGVVVDAAIAPSIFDSGSSGRGSGQGPERARGHLPTDGCGPRHARRGPRLHHTVVVSKTAVVD